MLEYGSNILAERNRRRINQSELASRLGWKTHTIVDIEQMRVGIDDDTYNRVMATLNEIEAEKHQVA
jgi:ribosome-binding protein aMBF1 (putative translation factor)